jgi:hypothetical protein
MRTIAAATTVLCLFSTAYARPHDEPPARMQCRAYSTAGGAWALQCEPQADARPRAWCGWYARLAARDTGPAARRCGR